MEENIDEESGMGCQELDDCRKDTFNHFCNNLYLGQWELAISTARLLTSNGNDSVYSDILEDLIKQPFGRSVLSESITSPCQLSWFCSLELEKIYADGTKKTNIPNRDLIQFHLLLSDICSHISDAHLKEIYLYFKWIHSSPTLGNPLTLSASLLKFLQSMLSRQPSLGHQLITSIFNEKITQLQKNNKSLKLVYVYCLNSLLDSLNHDELDSELRTNHVKKIYEILAYFDYDMSSNQMPIRQMLSKLLEHCQSEADIMSKVKIVSVLIGHKDLFILDEFCRLDYEMETNKAVSTYQACAELTEEQRWVLHLSTLGDINTRWKMFFMFTTKRNRHVLEVIMETGLALIKCSMFTELKRLVEPEELWPLKPLLLLLGWTHCYSCSEARQLLETLWNNKSECHHPAIVMGCNKLAYQIDLIQWCLDKAKPLLTEDTGGPEFQRASDLFKGLETHSVLYVLQNSTKLHSLDEQEVLNLLQKVPLQGQSDLDKEQKKTKTVRFVGDVSKPVTSLDQRKDMAIFMGYCILKQIMDAILFCANCSDSRLTNPVRPQRRHKVMRLESSRSRSDSCITLDELAGVNMVTEEDNASSSKTQVDIQKLYNEDVTNKLEQAKSYLSKLQPLTLRVEILENIFSLLFLTHEDIQETITLSEYNSDEGDDNKGTHSNSTDLVTPILSPLKGSLELRENVTLVNDSSVTEINMEYDVPFEELSAVKKNGESFGKGKLDMNKVEKALENIKSSIQAKRNLRKEAASGDGRNSSVSENISSMSTCSSINLDTIGFIVNDYVVRDIIAMLKLCIVNVSAARFQLYGNKSDARERHRSAKESVSVDSPDIDLNTEEALCRLVKSSITTDSLQKHITQLERYTSEAHWRYQLVSNENIPKSAGQVLKEVVMTAGDSSDEEVEIKGVGPQGRRRRRSASERKSFPGKEKTGQSPTTKTLIRQQSCVTVARKPLGQSRTPKLVALMLSSPATLLTMSIRKGQFTQTKQIIKLFKLEDRPETAEVYFAQAYHKACRSLQSVNGSMPQTPGTSSSKTGLRAVANAAAAGLTTASVSDIAEDILTFPTLPKVTKIDVNENLPQNIVDIFQSENLPVMILLDLATTSAKTWDVCNHLVDSIRSHLPSKSDAKSEEFAQSTDSKSVVNLSKQRVHKIRTFSDFVSQLQNVLQLGVEDDIPSREKAAFSKTFQKSIQYYLSHGAHSLNAEKDKSLALLFQNLHKYVHKVEEAFQIVEKGNAATDLANNSVKLDSQQRLVTQEHKPRSSSSTDRPVLHHCMKQLIHSLEKEVPDGGLVAFISKFQIKGQVRNKNYLLSLYEHCKELAYLVADSESHSRESMVVPRNYFEVLDEGPLRILGRMMFMKKMAPAKLEKVAAKLSLNLTHIIVYSCCIKIPSRRLPMLDAVPSHYAIETDTTGGKIIYNVAKSSISIKNPQDFLHDILLKLVTLMKDIAKCCNAQGLFDTTSAVMLSKNTDFYDIITQISALQMIDLNVMDKIQRKCFYGNLQTFMTIHCFVNHESAIDSQKTSSTMIEQCNIFKSYNEMSTTEQILFLSTFSYRVGQLGIISLFDLKYQINRCGLLAPSEWGRTLEHRLHPLSTSDPWFQLAPPIDPQLLFAVTTCCVSSPPIQVLDPANVSEQLYTSMKFYLQNCVEIDMKAKLVKIPELLLWYRKDFISGNSMNEVDRENDGLLAFIASHLSGEKETGLKQLFSYYDNIEKKESGSNVEIEVIPHCKDFMCVFNFDSVTQALKLHSHHGVESKNSHSRESTLSDSITYSLTPNTLEYIKSDCPLIATLVSLMCSDEMDDNLIDSAFDDSHFNHKESLDESIRSRTSSSMSMLDLRSYRYDKLTNDYPTLKRHLLNYIVPLAATEDPDILKGDDPILKLLTHDIVERYKTNILSLHESDGFQILLTGLVNELFSLRKWKEINQVIDCIPVTTVRHQTSLCNLHDFAVCCLIHKFCNASDDQGKLSKASSEEVTTLLLKLFSADGQAREVLTVSHKLFIEHNLDLFQHCLNRGIRNKALQESMQQKYKQIKVYYRITECAKNLQFKLSLQSTEFILEEDKIAAKKKHDILDKFTDWRTVVEYSHSSPKEVLGLLIKCGDYDTAIIWCSIEGLGDDIKLEIEENHVISALNVQPPNTTKAFMLLEDLKSSDTDACITMCRKFVEVFNKQHDVLFIADYMINQLSEWLEPTEMDRIRLIHIGAKMILCLPESIHLDYCHLVSTPRYILEQLIMNMKPELASKAFNTVVEEFRLVKDPGLTFTVEQFNTLVAFYAKKALEFTVIQYLEDKERSFSLKSSSSTDRLDLDHVRDSPVSRLSPRPDTLRRAGSRPLLSPHQGTSSPIHKSSSVTKDTSFIMPTEPPPREQWIPDSAASVCMVCKVERFSMFNRRHHCRRCGRVVCSGCSGNVTQIKGINARTCDDCYREIVKSSDGDKLSAASEIYSRTKLSDSSLTSSPRVALRTGSISVIHEEEESRSLAEVISHVHTTWKLHTDDHYNVNLREDFFFEQAPSTSLCISILNLHGNNRECGKLILHLCDDLSKFLKPLAPGIPNPEVDYNLIMSMMKYLLFHAKIKFTKCGDNVGMGQCDIYQGMVDLLALLVIDNFRDLPSIEELRKVDTVRRLRDKLIADERLSLAMEVSTKCGLDPTGVWVTWGMMCLQSGDFTGAREKFTKCLKPVKDKNVCSSLTKVLNDIVDCLESMPGTGTMEIQILLNNPGSIKNLINTPSSTFFEEASMDSQQFQECLYYLRTYGTYLSVVEFHRRHGYYMKAVQYILDHRCSNEVFVEGLLKPSIDSGELGRLTDQMLLLDPSLERWNTYLTASCRYLLKQRLHHVLYEFQLFMKDFIRAGMSCFTYFYQEGAQNYLDLSRRINHLFTAQQHMQAYLDPTHWGNVQHPLSYSTTQKPGSWDSNTTKRDQISVRLVKASEDVSRYIKTIALQIEVTKFFQSILTNPGGEVILHKMSTVGPSKIPTLFGSPQHRNDLAIMVLLCGDNIETSFVLATRITGEYKLGAVGIYTHVAREMARSHDYDNMRSFLTCVEKTEVATDEVMDEILGACLLVVADSPSEAKEAENIIKMLRKNSNMINAYILCGKLKSAYLMSVKENRVDDVRRILRAAKSMGQSAIVSICNKWLEQNQK
ncbi:hypothetical protein ACF0H5_003126 [Mactra antiquata]